MDLLFYHTRLKYYIVVELKAGAFKPEHVGQLNFYLSAVDARIKTPEDHPTILSLVNPSKKRNLSNLKNNSLLNSLYFAVRIRSS